MKVKIQAGANIEVATPREVRDELKAATASWFQEIGRGERHVRFAISADPAAGQIIAGAGQQVIGPDPGFVWCIERIAVKGYDPNPGTDALALYVGDVADSAIVIPKMDRFHGFSGREIVLYPGGTLVVAGSVATVNRMWITGQARELPLSLAWRL